MSSEQARELRRQGILAAKAGEKEQARHLLQQSLRLDPASEAGWLWLTTVARDQRERLFYLNKLLEINPNNEMGLQSLQSLGLTREQLAQQVKENKPEVKPAIPFEPEPAPPPRVQARPVVAVSQTQAVAPEPPPMSGVPVASSQRLTELQAQVDAMVRDYLAPLPAYPDVTWVRKTSQRAGERDSAVLRLYVAGGVAVLLVVLLIVGALVVWNVPELRGVVFAPTATLSPTPLLPTVTLTPTTGFTPTASPTPELSPTPSPTVPPSIPNGALVAPRPTEIYPPLLDRSLVGAVALVNQGQYEQAIPTLVVEVTRTSNDFDPSPYYYQALALAETGELDRAAQVLRDAERRLPERNNATYNALVNSGIAYVNLLRAQEALANNQFDEARALFTDVEDRAEEAITSDRRLELPYLTLAQRYSLSEDYDRVIDVLDRGLAVTELAANVNLVVAKGEAYFQQGEYDLAAYQAFVALYIDPAAESAHKLQIRTALAQERPGLAVLYVQAYLFYYPGSVEGYKLLGDARVAEGNVGLALEAYDQALAGGEDTPFAAEILVARAAIYSQQRRYDRARDDLSSAYTLTDDPDIRALRMLAAYSAGNTSVAQSDTEALLGSGVIPDVEIQLLQARILVEEADAEDSAVFEQALGVLNTIGAELPGDLQPVAEEYRARALYGLGQYGDAFAAINRALLGGETGSRHYLRGLILEAQGSTEAAIREYEWVVAWGEIYPFGGFVLDAERRLNALAEETQ